MALNISIWGVVTFPLAILMSLHRVYVAVTAPFHRHRKLDALWDELHHAGTFEEWEAAGLALDHRYRIDAWRRDDKSKDYAWELISDRLAAFALALQAGHLQAIVHLLQSGLVRNLGNITVPALYNASFAGTKYLIENYILQVCEIISDLAALPEPSGSSMAATPAARPVTPPSPPSPSYGGGSASGAAASSDVAVLPPLISPDLARAVRDGRCGELPSRGQKRQLLNNLRQSFGRSTLVLQGGSIFGVCHLGVARALFLRGLLPHIITGTGTGALVAALVGTHTDAELPGVFSGESINLEAFAKDGDGNSVVGGSGPPTTWDRASRFGFRTRWATLKRRLARFWREGYFLDVSILEKCVRDNGGHLTFEEAYRKTGRTLNITVVTGGARGDVPTVLNYVTAPNVLIWTAAVASNASDHDNWWFTGSSESSSSSSSASRQPPETSILCKDAAGHVVAWPLADAAQFRHWTYGSYGTRHSPLQRVAQLFNVNHFIVSQARPYLVPFLEPSMHSPEMRGRALGTLARGRAFIRHQIGHLVRHRLDQLVKLGWLPLSLRRLLLDEQVPGGHLVLVPRMSSLADYVRLLDAPTPATLRYWIAKGERAVWPAVAALKIRCSVELALEQACVDLGVPSGEGGSGIAGMGGRVAMRGMHRSRRSNSGSNLHSTTKGATRRRPTQPVSVAAGTAITRKMASVAL